MNRRITCLFVNLLWKLIPLRRFQCWLLDIHFETCPHCQKKLVSQEDWQAMLGGVSDLRLPKAVISRAWKQAEQAEDRTSSVLSGRISILLTRIYAAVMTVAIFILLFGFGWYFSQPG
ncbi:MAG: hypothetical protein PHU81_08285, partial [Acidobacteriota bacterium]|nr:hypothetical protein [Acidobacteriota bacterium]